MRTVCIQRGGWCRDNYCTLPRADLDGQNLAKRRKASCIHFSVPSILGVDFQESDPKLSSICRPLEWNREQQRPMGTFAQDTRQSVMTTYHTQPIIHVALPKTFPCIISCFYQVCTESVLNARCWAGFAQVQKGEVASLHSRSS